MITERRSHLALAVVALVALLTSGCIHHETRVYAPAEPTSLETRLEAARAITFMNERDQALGAVARDAARAGNVAVAKDALRNMTFLQARDDAAGDCALALSESDK